MKNLLKSIFFCSLLVFFAFSFKASATDLPQLYAKGVVLMDGKTGQVLYSQDENVQYEPASTTKVMTAIIVLENTKLTDKVTIGEKPTHVDGTAIGFVPGEVYTVNELLLGLLLESGNDCAEALAEHIAGSNAAFAELMNKKALELGAKNTTFKNPSGLHEDGHLTTAYDLSLIMKEALKHKDFLDISRTMSFKYETHPFPDGSEKWAINRNHCLNEYTPYYYKYAYSGKVGYTPEANHTYTAAAIKDDKLLIASFLNATEKDNQFKSVGPLFDYGFDNFEDVKLISKDQKIAEYKINDNITIPLLSDRDILISKKISEKSPNFDVNVNFKDMLKQPISKGQSLFDGNIVINNNSYSINLISGADRVYNLKVRFEEKLGIKVNSTKFLICISTTVLFFIVLIMFIIIYTNKKKKKRRRKKRF